MKTLAYTIASIIDANFNQGYSQQISGFSVEKASKQIDHGLKIRSRSAHNLFHGTVQAVYSIIDKLKFSYQHRKNIAQLAHLNEHLLNDIGFNLNDIESLKSGATTIEALNAQRRPNQMAHKKLKTVKTVSNTAELHDLECANEDSFSLQQCA